MKKLRQRKWDRALLLQALVPIVSKNQTMVSAKDLRTIDRNDLACAISRHGGYSYWAKQLGLDFRDSSTKLGKRFEHNEFLLFRKMGMKVEKQRSKETFDLMVNGKRVDVKCANIYNGSKWDGYAFAGLNYGKGCDFFDFLVLDNGKIMNRFIIPVVFVRKQTVTLTVGGLANKNHWIHKYADNLEALR
jgi:hypothetical protein